MLCAYSRSVVYNHFNGDATDIVMSDIKHLDNIFALHHFIELHLYFTLSGHFSRNHTTQLLVTQDVGCN